MRLKSLLTGAAIAVSIGASAQSAWVTDSVTMGAGYANDIFYSLKNGQQKSITNKNWHLAFQMTPQGPYGNVSIFANHVAGAVKVYSMHKQASTNFATVTAADTAGLTQLYNTDSSWNFGAFNRMPSNTPYDYSWGVYDINSHYVNGDSLYLVKVDTSHAYKVWVKQYISYPSDSVKWIFRIADLNGGAGDTTINLYQHDYQNRLFAYYDLVNKTASDREPNRYSWDFVFSRYIAMLNVGGPSLVPYPVNGVMNNFTVTTAVAMNVKADTAHYQNYPFSASMTAIGSDWKTFNMTTFTYEVDTMRTYFIKSGITNEYYQIQFTRFESATGKTVFRKRYISPTAIRNVNNSISSYYAAPNPANNSVSLMVDTKESAADAQLALVDLSGRVAFRQAVAINKGMNAFTINTTNLPAGLYMVVLNGSNLKLTQKITVAH